MKTLLTHPVPWSSQQGRWLQQLGLTLYDRCQHGLATVSQSRSQPGVMTDSPPPIQGALSDHEQHHPTQRRGQVVAGPAADPSVPARPVARVPDRLEIALLRACAGDPCDPQMQQMMANWPLDHLRNNPLAKRALWPQLREIRRKGVAH